MKVDKLLKTFLVSLVFALCPAFAVAQTRVLTGTVTDQAGVPVVGAAVISGPQNGVITDINGVFSISIPKGNAGIEVSCLGYETVSMTILPTQTDVEIVLKDDSMMLSETVVVGYGVQKKVNLTGAISTVTSKSLENRTAGTLTNMLQGAVPGLFVTTNAGTPNDVPSINIRGVNSVNGGNPLVLIDGVEGDMSKVNPQDVESVSVIKDASSSAIYGARASFGVILVTTKSGADTEGKPQVRYSGNIGFTTPTTCTDYISQGYWSVYIMDLFNRGTHNVNCSNYTEEDMQMLWDRVNDKTENPERPWVIIGNRNGKECYLYYCNTDWYHEMYVDFNPMQQHNFSVSGGTERMNYFFSAGYEHKEGTFKTRHDSYDKYNIRTKIDVKLSKHLKLSDNMSFYASKYDWPGNGSPDYTFCYGAVAGIASFPLTNPDGTYVYKPFPLMETNLTNGCHIELLADTKVNWEKKYNFSNTAELSVNLLDGLDIKGNYTYTISNYQKLNRWTNTSYSSYPGIIAYDTVGRFQNMLEERYNFTYYQAANVYASYVREPGPGHHLSAVAGFNYEHEYFKEVYCSGRNLSSDYISDFNLVQADAKTGKKIFSVTGGQSEYAIAGLFGRLNYDYLEKYLFELSGRYDGTSRFDAEHRWGFFPSASAGWKFSQEDFMSGVDWVNIAKLRFSYGALGNQQVGNYDFIRTMDLYTLGYTFGTAGQRAAGSGVSSPNSGNLTWEVARHYNLGLDLSMLGNRLLFTGEAYIRDTQGMLTAGMELPSVYGTSTPLENAANLRSKGYELSLTWKDSFKLFGRPFNYSVNATLADYISVITKYANPARLLGTYYEGMVMGEIWGFLTDGLFSSDEEAIDYTTNVCNQSYVAYNLNGGWRAGDLKFKDLNGNKTLDVGSVTIDDPGDKRIIGNSNPRYQYGFTLSGEYMGFDLSVFFHGIGHQDWYPTTYCHSFWFTYNQEQQTFVPTDWLSKVWSEDNPDAYFPRPRCWMGNQGGTYLTTINDRYLQNIGYFRFKNLTFGYTLPDRIVKALTLQKVRVYFTGENLAYTSAFKKINRYMDPEQVATSTYLGFRYPWQKSFIWGIDVTF